MFLKILDFHFLSSDQKVEFLKRNSKLKSTNFIRDKTEISHSSSIMDPPEELLDEREVADTGVGAEFEGYRYVKGFSF